MEIDPSLVIINSPTKGVECCGGCLFFSLLAKLKNHTAQLHQFFMHVVYVRGLILLWWHHRVKYIFYLESIRPIRTAENFEAVEWATGFANKHGCIVGLLKETGSVFVKVRT